MFTHNVHMRLKPDCCVELTRTLNGEVLTLLRNQEGFRRLIAFIAPDEKEALVFTFWDQEHNSAAYHRGAYPQVRETLAKVIEGIPEVHALMVSSSTLQRMEGLKDVLDRTKIGNSQVEIYELPHSTFRKLAMHIPA
jgi:23S rRNA A2030 N6-methylase RlmJ